jgi:ribose-phosphate pyrophosphokinase
MKICKFLNVNLCKTKVSRFSDGEIQVEINESVRGMDTFIVQSTCPPVNDNLMELLSWSTHSKGLLPEE